jgi:HlyD family secretion protein
VQSTHTTLAIAAACAAALAAIGLSPDRGRSEAVSPAASEAARENVVALARLEPASRVVRLGASLDDVVAEVAVREGERVQRGQLLLRFASAAAREAELESARLARERVELVPFEIDAQRARVRTGEAERAHAVAEVERQRGLSKQGFLTGQEFRDAELRARVSADALASARAELARLEQSLDLERRSADNAVKRAEELLAQTRIAAPIDGEVLKLSVRPGERSGGQPLVHLGETREMMAVAEVHANDIRFVKLGQRALFTSAALADGIEGVVDQVGAAIYDNRILGEDPSAPRGLRVFEVHTGRPRCAGAVRILPQNCARRWTGGIPLNFSRTTAESFAERRAANGIDAALALW